jgi:hypothetical protein
MWFPAGWKLELDREMEASFVRMSAGLFDRLRHWMTEHLKSPCKAVARMRFWRLPTRIW